MKEKLQHETRKREDWTVFWLIPNKMGLRPKYLLKKEFSFIMGSFIQYSFNYFITFIFLYI